MTPAATGDAATAYAKSVATGSVPACKWVKLACQRHLADLERSATDAEYPYHFDAKEAARRIEFCATLRHYKGPAKGHPFILEPWQSFIVGSVFGWKVRATKLRRFRYALVIVPRKAGKTFLASAVALQLLVAGGNLQEDGTFSVEHGAEVYFVATKEDQAKIGWSDCVRIARRSPGFADVVSPRVKELRYDPIDGVCRPLGADSDSLDGLNPSAAVKDELHAWKSRDLWDVIEDAFGAREQPLAFVISTEGTVRGGIFDEQLSHAKNVLEGGAGYTDDAYFAVIYTIDEGDDPFAESSWWKSNPNLGISKSLDYMRDQSAKARLMPAKLATFLTKQLNVRVNAATAWLSAEAWEACAAPVDPAALHGAQCVVGLDLARSKDMSSAAALFPDGNGGVEVLMRYWLPEDELEARIHRDRVPYDQWARAGFLTLTEGNVTDFRQIEADLVAWKNTFALQELAYDPMFATDLALRLRDDHGFAVTEFAQTYKNYTLPCKELERLIAGRQIRHGGHPILRWNAANVIVREGPSGNLMPDKAKSSARIDGIAAVIMALGRVTTATEVPAPGISFL